MTARQTPAVIREQAQKPVQDTDLIAFSRVRAGVPDDVFADWLLGGLRMVESCKPGGVIWRAMRAQGRV